MCDGPRTSRICILLKYRVLQKIDVRGPHFSEGTTNKVISHSAVSQRIMKSRCSRSVVRRCDPGWCSGSFTPPPDPSLRLQILHSACGYVQDDRIAATLRMTRATTFMMTDNGFVQDECSVPDPSLPLRMTRAAAFWPVACQFLKLWIGAGIRPVRLMNSSQLNLFTGIIGAWPRSPPNSTFSPTFLPVTGIILTAVVF